MNLKFLKNLEMLNEDHEKKMSREEMKTYLKLLYKKCAKSEKDKFNDYLAKKCDMDVEDVTIEKCSAHLCDNPDKCDEVIHHLENMSEKVDEHSLMNILGNKKDLLEERPTEAISAFLNSAHGKVYQAMSTIKRNKKFVKPEDYTELKHVLDTLAKLADNFHAINEAAGEE